MTILGCDKLKYKKNIHHFFLHIAVVSAAVIALNVLLAVFRTDATHTAFLIINILTDITLLWTMIYFLVAVIIPRKRLLAVYERGEKNGKAQIGTVTHVSEKTTRYQGFTCRALSVETGSIDYELYLIESGMELKNGTAYKLQTVENLIISAEEVR